jgi:hypothetical protein
MGMAWVVFFIIAWLFVIAALYTWYRATENEKRVRQLERR